MFYTIFPCTENTSVHNCVLNLLSFQMNAFGNGEAGMVSPVLLLFAVVLW